MSTAAALQNTSARSPLPSNLTQGQQIKPSVPAPVAANLSQSPIDKFACRLDQLHENAKYVRDGKQLIVRDLVAFHWDYAIADAATQLEYKKLINDKCSALGIENIATSSIMHQITKIAFGDDAKKVSAIVYVAEVLIAWNKKEHEALDVMRDNGGIQAIRTKFKRDGSKKSEKTEAKRGTSSSNAKANPEQIAQFKQAIAARPLYTIPAQSLPDLSHIKEGTECTMIAVRAKDGNWVITAVVEDTTVTEAAYASCAVTFKPDEIVEEIQPITAKASETFDGLCAEAGI